MMFLIVGPMAGALFFYLVSHLMARIFKKSQDDKSNTRDALMCGAVGLLVGAIGVALDTEHLIGAGVGFISILVYHLIWRTIKRALKLKNR